MAEEATNRHTKDVEHETSSSVVVVDDDDDDTAKNANAGEGVSSLGTVQQKEKAAVEPESSVSNNEDVAASNDATEKEAKQDKENETTTISQQEQQQELEVTKEDTIDETIGESKDSQQQSRSRSPPPRPPKRARTAYFIFADTVRPQIQQHHQGVANQAKAIGAKWQAMAEEEKQTFKQQAALEKEKLQIALKEYEDKYGKYQDDEELLLSGGDATTDLVFPVARIRKIAKLDPEVKTLSKEALQLVVKSAELALAKLGNESVKVARLQNRRTLVADDVAHVCAHREAFRFLKNDLTDLTKAVAKQKQQEQQQKQQQQQLANGSANGSKKEDRATAAAAGTKPLTAYFGAVASNK